MYMRHRAPDTLTEAEQRRLLAVTAQAPRPRDHVLFSMALGTGLRLSELLALNVGDITSDGVAIRTRVRLRGKNGRRAAVFLPDEVGETMHGFVSVGSVAEQTKAAVITPGQGILGDIWLKREAEIIAHTTKDPRAVTIASTETAEDEGMMVAPLLSGAVLGCPEDCSPERGASTGGCGC